MEIANFFVGFSAKHPVPCPARQEPCISGAGRIGKHRENIMQMRLCVLVFSFFGELIPRHST